MESLAEIKKHIILDTRENKEEFISYLADSAKTKGYDIHLEALPFGDIQYGSIIVERKEINDFVSSITSDRMWEQIIHMKANPEVSSIILVSGTFKDLWKNNRDKIPQIEGAFLKILACGIPLKCLDNDCQLVDFTLKLFDHSKPLEEPVKRVEKNKKMSLFMALPGVGYKSCKTLMKEFSTMEELVNDASLKDLQKILGPKKGQHVFEALR